MRLASCAFVVLALTACSKPKETTADSAAASAPIKKDDAPKAGKLAWTDPPAWKKNPPSSPMRVAEYVVPKAADADDGECVVTTFGPGMGGSVEMNIDRWIRQFEPGDSTHLEKSEENIAGMHVTEVDLTGTYRGMGMNGAAQAAKSAQGMLGAVVESPSGLWFFKVTGPTATVTAAKPAFHALIGSIHPS